MEIEKIIHSDKSIFFFHNDLFFTFTHYVFIYISVILLSIWMIDMMRAHNLVVSFYVWYKILGFNISRERSLSDNNEKSPFSYMCVDVYIKKIYQMLDELLP